MSKVQHELKNAVGLYRINQERFIYTHFLQKKHAVI